MEKVFAKGIYFNEKRENAPEWVLGGIDVKPADFIQWINKQATNSAGYVKLDIKRAKSGKPYLELNTYVSKNDIKIV